MPKREPPQNGSSEDDSGRNSPSSSEEPSTPQKIEGVEEGAAETAQYIYTVNKSTNQVMKIEEVDPTTSERKELPMQQGPYSSGYNAYGSGVGYGTGQGYEGYTGYGAGSGGSYDPYA